MTMTVTQIWTVIVLLGIGTYLIRFSFIGFIGNRPMPPLVLRMLRYTPVAVLPGMVAPLVLWPGATGGETDPARLCAAIVVLVVGLWRKAVLPALFAGAGTLAVGLYLTGQL